MKEKNNKFLTIHVDILEEFLEYLWKDPITIKEKYIYTIKNILQVDFVINERETIRMKADIDLLEGEIIVRVKYTSHDYQDFDEFKNFLALSFCYQCPQELELCNQFGLYQKKDLQEMEGLEDIDLINQYKIERNMLGNNPFYLFNMQKIKDHCQDKVLDQLLQELDKAIKNYYYKKEQ